MKELKGFLLEMLQLVIFTAFILTVLFLMENVIYGAEKFTVNEGDTVLTLQYTEPSKSPNIYVYEDTWVLEKGLLNYISGRFETVQERSDRIIDERGYKNWRDHLAKVREKIGLKQKSNKSADRTNRIFQAMRKGKPYIFSEESEMAFRKRLEVFDKKIQEMEDMIYLHTYKKFDWIKIKEEIEKAAIAATNGE